MDHCTNFDLIGLGKDRGKSCLGILRHNQRWKPWGPQLPCPPRNKVPTVLVVKHAGGQTDALWTATSQGLETQICREHAGYKSWNGWIMWDTTRSDGNLSIQWSRGEPLTPEEVEDDASLTVVFRSGLIRRLPRMNSTHWKWLWTPLWVIAQLGRLLRARACGMNTCSCLYVFHEKWHLGMVLLPWPPGRQMLFCSGLPCPPLKTERTESEERWGLSNANFLWVTSLLYVSRNTEFKACLWQHFRG